MTQSKVARSFVVIAVALGTALLCAGNSPGATILVPSDYPTIQAAIDAAEHGDQIVVAPGTYNEAIDLQGKLVILRSEAGPEVTTIDASGLEASAVTLNSGEGPMTMIDGFTITGGSGTRAAGQTRGGGVYIMNAAPTIADCIVTGNAATRGGGLFAGPGGQPWIVESHFRENEAVIAGGGLYAGLAGSPPGGLIRVTAIDSSFEKNTASSGGAIDSADRLTLIGCLIRGNSASGGAGGVAANGTATVIDSTFKGNPGWALAIGPDASAILSGSTFKANPDGAVLAWATESILPLTVEQCTFSENSASSGAAITASGGIDLEIVQSTFESNTTTGAGGAIHSLCDAYVKVVCPHVSIAESSFTHNTTGGNGGAIATGCGLGVDGADCSVAAISESEFVRNEAAGHGGAIHNRCISWTDPQTHGTMLTCGEITVLASNLQQNSAGAGGGAIANLGESTTILEDTVLCNNVPDHVLGDWEDEGGNDLTALADLTCDGTVGIGDLLILLAAWGECDDPEPGACTGDINGDDAVGVVDLLLLLSKWTG